MRFCFNYLLSILLSCICTVAFAQVNTQLKGKGNEQARAVLYDNYGNYFILADYQADAQLDSTQLPAFEGTAILLAKFNALGQLVWKQCLGSVGVNHGVAFVIDEHNNLFVCGNFEQTLSNNGPGSAISINSSGSSDLFLAQLNAFSGAIDWIVANGSSNTERAMALAIDQADGAIVQATMETPSKKDNELFLVRMARYDGNLLLRKRIFKTNNINLLTKSGSIVCDDLNNVYIGCPFSDTIVLLNDKNRAKVVANSTAALLIEKCDLDLMQSWNTKLEAADAINFSKDGLIYTDYQLYCCLSTKGSGVYTNGLEVKQLANSTGATYLLNIAVASGNLSKSTVIESGSDLNKVNFHQPKTGDLMLYVNTGSFLNIYAISASALTALVKIPAIDFECCGICANFFTDELIVCFTYNKAFTLLEKNFIYQGGTELGLYKLSLTAYKTWNPEEHMMKTEMLSTENYLMEYHKNDNQSLLSISYINTDDKQIHATIYNFAGIPVKVLANELQDKGLKQIYCSMSEFPYGYYIFELNGKRKPIYCY